MPLNNTLYPWQKNDWARCQSMRQRLPQGLLFKGAVGIGKLNFALLFAHSLLCQNSESNGLACGHCPACHWLMQDNHPDFCLVQPDSLQVASEGETDKKASKHISVDAIRNLSDFISMSSHQGGVRVVLIHPAEAMNANAANALLKSLEEPPAGLIFLLVSHKASQLLPTILSRCVQIPVGAPTESQAITWLQQQGINNPQQALSAAGFSPLIAVQSVAHLQLDTRDNLLRGLANPKQLDVYAEAEALFKLEQEQIVNWLQQWCYDLMAVQYAGRVRYFPQQQLQIQRLLQHSNPLALPQLQKRLVSARREAQHTLNAKLFIENLLLSYRQLMLA